MHVRHDSFICLMCDMIHSYETPVQPHSKTELVKSFF